MLYGDKKEIALEYFLSGKSNLENTEEAFELLKELEMQKTDNIRNLREHHRYVRKVNVSLRPANASSATAFEFKGITGDISRKGCSAMFNHPVGVGDLFALSLESEEVELQTIIAKCVLCRFIKNNSFLSGFSFFESLDLPELGGPSEDDILI